MPLPDVSGVSDDAKALHNFMEEILEKVEAAYISYNMPLPSRRYWTFGQPSVDCEQLVVSFIQMYLGSPGDEATEPRRCRDPRSAVVNVSVSRQVPVVGQSGKPPADMDITDGSVAPAYDAWILMESAASLDTWEQTGYGLGIIATVEAIAPEGGYQTVTMTLTAAIP
jgi:hypothetical protein